MPAYGNTRRVSAIGCFPIELRYPDEFVRHKILDLIGDLYLLGFSIRGRYRQHDLSWVQPGPGGTLVPGNPEQFQIKAIKFLAETCCP